MRKRLSVTALILAVLMIALCCAACGGEKTIIGTWRYTVDFEEIVRAKTPLDTLSGDELTYAEKMLEIYKDVTGVVVMEFKEDGTYSISADQETMASALEDLKANLSDILPDLIGILGQDMSEFEAQIQANGYTIEMYIDALFSQLDLNSLTENLSSSGRYRLDGDKLYTSDQDGTIDESHYLIIELSGSKLKITEAVGSDSGDSMLAGIYLPMELTRA